MIPEATTFIKVPRTMKLSSFLSLAAVLLATLASEKPSQASSVSFTYTTSGGGTLTGTLFAGSAVTPAPSVTVTAISPTTGTVAPISPAVGSGASY